MTAQRGDFDRDEFLGHLLPPPTAPVHMHTRTEPMTVVVNRCSGCGKSLDLAPNLADDVDKHRRIHTGCLLARRHARVMARYKERYPEDFTESGELLLRW